MMNNNVARGMVRPSSAATRRKGDPVGIYNDKLDSTMRQMLGYGQYTTSGSKTGKITNTRSAGNSGAFMTKSSKIKNQTVGAFHGFENN